MNIALKVDVPIASFPTSRSREYRDTYPVPPLSTVYGMLLSLVGETDRFKHCGIQLAIALLAEPVKSVTLRKIRRFKEKTINNPQNSRPDFQEILTGIELIVWVATGEDKANPNLCDRITTAFANPSSVNRFGALCLGESRDIVNTVELLSDVAPNKSWQWLLKDEYGYLSLPYWVDHVGSRHTRWLRYSLGETEGKEIPNSAWTTIQLV